MAGLSSKEQAELDAMNAGLSSSDQRELDMMNAAPGVPDALRPDVPSSIARPQAPKTGRLEAAARGAATGATGGWFERIGASLGTYGFNPSMASGGGMSTSAMDASKRRATSGDPSGTREYEERLAAERAANDKARADRPWEFGLSEAAGSVAGPIKVPGRGGGFFGKIGRGAAESAAYGAGQSRADTLSGRAADAGLAGLIGGGVSAAASGIAAGAKGAYRKLRGSDWLQSRIINEAAQGPLAKASPTAQKHLDRAAEPIVEEVLGPDGKRVRAAVLGGAKEGRKEVAAVLDPVRQAKDDAYAAFKAAGRDSVPPDAYRAKLQAAIDDSIARGKGKQTKALKAALAEFDQQVKDGGGKIDLVALRGFTSDVQDVAAGAVGGLNDHTAARLKAKVGAVVSKAMDQTLDEAAAGNKTLAEAAKAIRAKNRRTDALLTLDKGLKSRQPKETSGDPLLTRAGRAVGRSVAGGGALAAAGALASDDEERVGGALKWGLMGLALGAGAPALAKGADRGITGAAIRRARRGSSPALDAASSETGRRAAAPFFAKLGRGLREDDDEREKKR